MTDDQAISRDFYNATKDYLESLLRNVKVETALETAVIDKVQYALEMLNNAKRETFNSGNGWEERF